MQVKQSDRGFRYIVHPNYAEPGESRLVSQSSAIGDHEDSWDRPGASFLWVGQNHHLNREEVAELVKHLQSWLATGSLEAQQL